MNLANKKKSYTKETVIEALGAVEAGMSLTVASIRYKIPKATLRWKQQRANEERRRGPDAGLTESEEQALAKWVADCSSRGMPVMKRQILDSVTILIKLLNRRNTFLNDRPGRNWFRSFVQRNPSVARYIRENALLTKAPVTERGIREWFSKVENELRDKHLLNVHPSRVFTMETVSLLNLRCVDKVEKFSVHIAGNAAGDLAPYLVIFENQETATSTYLNLSQNWVCAKSENGCMTAEVLFGYLTKHFFPWLYETGIEFPSVLYLDGEATHLTLPLTDFCLRNRIEIVTLHQKSRYILQPLQMELFPLMKNKWELVIEEYQIQMNDFNSFDENLANHLKKILDGYNVSSLVRNGFLASGLFPLSPDNCDYKKIAKKYTPKNEYPEITPYIPDKIFASTIEKENIPYNYAEKIKYVQLLYYIEKLVDDDIIQSFKNHIKSDKWSGRQEDTSLFYVWKKIVNLSKMDENFNL